MCINPLLIPVPMANPSSYSPHSDAKQQAKRQLRSRTLVLGYAATCLLAAKELPVQAVEREGIIAAPK